MKLLLVALDGLRADVALPQVVASNPAFAAPDHPGDERFRASRSTDAEAPDTTGCVPTANAPTLQRLAAGGCVLPLWMTPPTDSGPGWASLLTGTRHEENNVWWNEMVGHRLAQCPDILTRLWAAAPRARTYAASAWSGMVGPAGPGPIVQRRPAQEAVDQHRVFSPGDRPLSAAEGDALVCGHASQYLNHEGPDAAVVYFEGVDEAGHQEGADSACYRAAISTVDEHVRYLVKAVAERVEQLREEWLIAVTTDHGHRDSGGHGEDEVEVRRSFLLLHRLAPDASSRPSLPVTTPRSLRSEQVVPLLLRLLGVQEGSTSDAQEWGLRRDVSAVGPTRDLRFEW